MRNAPTEVAPLQSSKGAPLLAVAILSAGTFMLGIAVDEVMTYPASVETKLPAQRAELLLGDKPFGFSELWQMEQLLAAYVLHRSKVAGRGKHSPKHE